MHGMHSGNHEVTVVAEGGLARLKELLATLAGAGVAARVLPPGDGCHNR